MSPDEPVTVYKAWNPRQAHLVCQVLANADIEARVASDALEMALGDVPFQQATSPVLVHAADAERARAVLAEFDAHLADRSAEPRDGGTPFCYHCGEAVAAGQSPCPHCGGELDLTE